MDEPIIRKSGAAAGVQPNLTDYEKACAEFSWEAARAELDGLPDGGLNIAYEALDRHVANGRGGKLALRWLGKKGEVRDFTYAELNAAANRFANVLAKTGIEKGDRVYTLAGRVPELYIAALGALKRGAVFSPLFSVFGPEPIRTRINRGEGRALVTTERLYKKKIAPWRSEIPSLDHVFLIDGREADKHEEVIDLQGEMDAASEQFEIAQTGPEDMALLHFTSGTTGRPKGAIHVHEAVVAHHITGKYALDLHKDDVYWCTADPGWVTGTSYGIISPLTNGVTMIVDEADFDAERWYSILRDQNVTVWYTAPTAIRMLMRAGADMIEPGRFDKVRFMASVGEPLNPEAVVWSNEKLGRPFHDNWWQTETGGIMIANFASEDIKPGSMGRPLPGVEAGLVQRGDDGSVREVAEPMKEGELALKSGWPSMFRGYLHEEERYRKNFAGEWYLTGDLAMRDKDGYFWFVGRADDVIKSAGHLIGPFEVESALVEHPAVSEAAVIGVPDPVAGETVKAFVALNPDYEESDALLKDILGHARKRLGPAVAPKEIVFRKSLPRTRSGKIMRRLLKARELGLPEGDISTLESDET
ncbi:acetate--CoA ligase [Hyphococcus luteus]|uniref:acetate--CoA ligase n=1 Tax=Hyphococcus luteus TaxID=2058213 RepID=A0A2S7KA91_9PROT|nr:acetate--CoA ligase [Marinicaulis flavus]PQA89391.1 acetate--CoA ligase [Marinicaulis flavus]